MVGSAQAEAGQASLLRIASTAMVLLSAIEDTTKPLESAEVSRHQMNVPSKTHPRATVARSEGWDLCSG